MKLIEITLSPQERLHKLRERRGETCDCSKCQEQLDEGIKDAIVAAMISLGVLSGASVSDVEASHDKTKMFKSVDDKRVAKSDPRVVKNNKVIKKHVKKKIKVKIDERTEKLTKIVISKYKAIDKQMAAQIVIIAKKHEKPDFPRAEDILAIIGVESSFKPHAVSKDGHDLGLMQVRAKAHKLSRSELKTIDQQIKIGAKILRDYYMKLKQNERKTIMAYNSGLTKTLRGVENVKYFEKFRKERELYGI